MNRSTWNFAYTIEQLRDAAIAKRDWHEGRLKWWDDKRDETEAKIKSEGIEIDKSVAFGTDGYFSNKSHRRGASVTINNDLLDDFQECHSKVSEHQNKVKEYNGWVEVFSSQPLHHTLNLHQDDWLFFFGK